MSPNPVVRDAQSLLSDVGLRDVDLLRDRYDSGSFGNGEAVFQIGKLVVRFTRDRGQDFIDVASKSQPDKFYQFDDVDLAMGWTSIDRVLAKSAPEEPRSVLTRLARHFAHLEDAFSGEQERLTRARIEKAAKARGEAFVASLRR